MYKLSLKQCFNLIFEVVLDHENAENFTDEFKEQINEVIKKIRE